MQKIQSSQMPDELYWSINHQKRITVTELARSKSWQTELPDLHLVEITDRGSRCGWLVSDDTMADIMAAYSTWRRSQEQQMINNFVELRDTEDRKVSSGNALADAAKSYLKDNIDVVKEAVYGA